MATPGQARATEEARQDQEKEREEQQRLEREEAEARRRTEEEEAAKAGAKSIVVPWGPPLAEMLTPALPGSPLSVSGLSGDSFIFSPPFPTTML